MMALKVGFLTVNMSIINLSSLLKQSYCIAYEMNYEYMVETWFRLSKGTLTD